MQTVGRKCTFMKYFSKRWLASSARAHFPRPISPPLKKIDKSGKRFYVKEGSKKQYPSVRTVLQSVYSKDYSDLKVNQFKQQILIYLRENSFSEHANVQGRELNKLIDLAQIESRKAAAIGSSVHN